MSEATMDSMPDSSPDSQPSTTTPPSTQTSSSSDTKGDFALFPKLPTELRFRIWRFALPGPRIVKLTAKPCFTETRTTKQDNDNAFTVTLHYRFHFRFGNTISSINNTLRACRESRQVAIKQLPIRIPTVQTRNEIRIAEDDVVRIDDLSVLFEGINLAADNGIKIPPVFDKIHTLVFVHARAHMPLISYTDAFFSPIASKSLLSLPNLRRFLLVVDETSTSCPKNLDGFTTGEYDLDQLNDRQRRYYNDAVEAKSDIISAIKQAKITNYEVQIMTQNWPKKPVESSTTSI